MKLKRTDKSGFTRIELLVVVTVITLLLTIGVNKLFGFTRKGYISYCKYNFIQTYIALTEYKTDTENKYPWQVSEQDGGSLEYVALNKQLNTYKHWLTLAKYLENPKVLRCSSDRNRTPANSWLEKTTPSESAKGVVPFNGNKVFSYFIAIEAKPDSPKYIISGDRNIFYGKYNNDADKQGKILKIFKKFTPKKSPGWTHSIHDAKGILLMGDGSTPYIKDLRNELVISKNEKNKFHFPRGM